MEYFKLVSNGISVMRTAIPTMRGRQTRYLFSSQFDYVRDA
jgi:hypothetical protein